MIKNKNKENDEMMNKNETVVILDSSGEETVGELYADTLDGQGAMHFMGEIVTVHLRDENGNPIEVQGRLIAIL